jgi:DNA-directed RNA polymerase subunit RPC12/RpoP
MSSEKCLTCGRDGRRWETQSQVELIPAYVWDCPECGRENFQRGIIAPITEEDREEMVLEENAVGHWTTIPNVVTCKHCGSAFDTVSYGDDEDDEGTDGNNLDNNAGDSNDGQ